MGHCYGCGRIDRDVVLIEFEGETVTEVQIFIHASTSKGEIGFCSECFEGRRFDGFTPEDIVILNWHFGSAFVEANPKRAIELLDPILTRWRTPDSLSPLGRAYIQSGRIDEGRALLLEALSHFPRHPYVAQDRAILAELENRS